MMEYLLSRKWSGLGNLTVSGLTIQVPREAVGRKKAHLKDGSWGNRVGSLNGVLENGRENLPEAS